MLRFSEANAKTKKLNKVRSLARYLKGRKVYSLDLSSGWSCPGACDCMAKVHMIDGKPKLIDGPKTRFRCFSASQEVQYPNTRLARLHNFKCFRKMQGSEQCRDLILKSLPRDIGILRYHVAGDFFKLAYLIGAIAAAEARPDVLFYGYTKSFRHLLRIRDWVDPSKGLLRPNFLLTASLGSKYDNLVPQLGLRSAIVVNYRREARKLGLSVDSNDSHAATPGGSYALLIHGTQPAGSKASKAVTAQRKNR